MTGIKRDLTKMTYWCSNETFDFYVWKIDLKYWYTVATDKGTDIQHTMAGFTTRKAARHCAEVWATWMK